MASNHKEKWMELCELAANEQDPEKLTVLIEEVDRLLEAREKRLQIDTALPSS